MSVPATVWAPLVTAAVGILTVGWNIVRERSELRKLERFAALAGQLPAGSRGAAMLGDIRNRLAVRVALTFEAPPYRFRFVFGWALLGVGFVVAVGWVVFADITAGPGSWTQPVVWGVYVAGLVVAMAGQGVLVFRDLAVTRWKETRFNEYADPSLSPAASVTGPLSMAH